MNQMALKIAASALVVSMTTAGCTSAKTNFRPTAQAAVPAPARPDDAAGLFAKSDRALAQGDLAQAVGLAEQAVELAPSDASYRQRLANLYLRAGRFASAETTYGDVLALVPGNHRAALNRALSQIALGDTALALGTIDRLAAAGAPSSDVGLAYALAGQPARGLDLLEPAARSDGADARVRQNLALAYALSGDWQKARVVASQDLSPIEIGPRMRQWAAMAAPTNSYDQVASLLGVTPAADAGQPMRLALVAQGPALAAADSAVPAPGDFNPPTFAPIPAAQAFADDPEANQPRFAAAVEALADPEPAAEAAPVPAFNPLKKKPRVIGRGEAFAATAARSAPTKLGFVVQLGAFSSADNAERAWSQIENRYGLSGHGDPLSTTVSLPGRGTFHRLSVAGFGDRGEAVRACGSIRAKGGACFVRFNAGDAPLRFASRQNKTRRA